MSNSQFLPANQKISKSINLQEVQQGDILLFRPSKKVTFSQKCIMLVQAVLSIKHGHYDTVHVGVCTGKDASKNICIAHVTLVPQMSSDYHHEPLKVMLDREGGDRSFILYRHVNPEIRHSIGEMAALVNQSRAFKWSLYSAAKCVAYTFGSFFHKTANPENISYHTCCSKFAIEVLKPAPGHKPLAISPQSTPKKLESFLESHKKFQKMHYYGMSPFDELVKEIKHQLQRLADKPGVFALIKYQQANAAFNRYMQNPDLKNIRDETKVRALLKIILPILSVNTSINFCAPKSFKSVCGLARKMGIFHKEILPVNHRIPVLPSNDAALLYHRTRQVI